MSGTYSLIKRADIRSGESDRRTFGTDSLITGKGRGHSRPADKTEHNHKQKKKSASKMAKQSRKRNRG